MVFQKKMALSRNEAGFVPGLSGGRTDRDERVSHLLPNCDMLVFHHQRGLVTLRLVFHHSSEHCKEKSFTL